MAYEVNSELIYYQILTRTGEPWNKNTCTMSLISNFKSGSNYVNNLFRAKENDIGDVRCKAAFNEGDLWGPGSPTGLDIGFDTHYVDPFCICII